MPEKTCPVCGEALIRDGFNIPYETFFGCVEPKYVDIDLFFAPDYRANACQHLRELFGADRVVCPGTIGTVPEWYAEEIVGHYADLHGMTYSDDEKNERIKHIIGVSRFMAVHPGELFIIPQDMEIEDFCPVQSASKSRDTDEIITQFEYWRLEDSLVEFGLLGHHTLGLLSSLAEKAGVDLASIPMGDEDTLALFRSSAPLGIEPDDILHGAGIVGIREYSGTVMEKMLEEVQPTDFDGLMRIYGLAHGANVWLGNAEALLSEGKASIKEVVGTRDDIFLDLCAHGVDRKTAFSLMEGVRKGRPSKIGFPDGTAEMLREHDLPDWYAESLEKIQYLFPKAHAATDTLNAYRLAWFKVHEPLAFYSVMLAHYSKMGEFDSDTAFSGIEAVRECLLNWDEVTPEEDDIYPDERDNTAYLLAYEFLRRGFAFLREESGDNHFLCWASR